MSATILSLRRSRVEKKTLAPWQRRAIREICEQIRRKERAMRRPLVSWTIYDHPRDYPDVFVARKFLVEGGAATPTRVTIVAATLAELRRRIREVDPNLVPFARSPSDDKTIVEAWL